MVPEIGQISLALALCLAIALAVFPLAGAHAGNARWMDVARPCALGMLAFTALAFAMLAVSFFRHDFSVQYVALNSNLKLPAMYRFAAIWGAHEGSLVLWQLILSAWTAAVALASRTLPQVLRARVLGVLGLVSIGFLLFILLTSNPFVRLFPAAEDGADLNPLLQDPAWRYIPHAFNGYVGLAVPFARDCRTLRGRLDRLGGWTRPWTTAAGFPTGRHRPGDGGVLRVAGAEVVLGPWRTPRSCRGCRDALIHTLAGNRAPRIFATRRCCWRCHLRPEPARTFPGRSGVSCRCMPSPATRRAGFFILVFWRSMGGALLPVRVQERSTNPQTGSSWFHASRCWSDSPAQRPTCWCCSDALPAGAGRTGHGQDLGGPPYFNLVSFSPCCVLLVVARACTLPGRRPIPRLGAQAEGARRRCGSCRNRPHGRGLRICGNIDRHRDTHRRMGHCLGAARPRCLAAQARSKATAFDLGHAVGALRTRRYHAGHRRGVRLGVEPTAAWRLGESLEVSGIRFQLDRIEDVQGRIPGPRRACTGFPRRRPVTSCRKARLMKYREPDDRGRHRAGWATTCFVALGEPLARAPEVRVQVKPLVRSSGWAL